MFLSDNGACAEPYAELGGGKVSEINDPSHSGMPSYGRAWAQVSNTPFRKYKCRSYEGGISTPLIVSWKNNLNNKKWGMVPCSRLSAGHYADYSGSNRSCLPGNLSRWKQNTSIGRQQPSPRYS